MSSALLIAALRGDWRMLRGRSERGRFCGQVAIGPTWQPGNYAVKLSGTNGSTGIGLIELFEY